MPSIGRKTLQSVRARSRRIDVAFQYIGYAMILLYFCFVIGAWISYRDAVRINSVEVLGAHAVDGEKIASIATSALHERLLWKIDRNNALLYPKARTVKAIYQLDGRVKSVSLEISPIKHLVVTINEYAPKLLACPNMATSTEGSTTCYLGDDEGYVFARAPEYSGFFFPIFITHGDTANQERPIGTHVLPPNEFSAIQSFLSSLRDEGFTPRQIDYTGEHDYEIATERPWNIRWSSNASSTESIMNLKLVLQAIGEQKTGIADLKVVDLRFGNKIFYR